MNIMNKPEVITIDSSKCDIFVRYNDFININLNALIRKKHFDADYIGEQIIDLLFDPVNINFTNLASLCYKLKIGYSSNDCLELIKYLVSIFKDFNPKINFVEAKVTNQGELDIAPFENLLIYDKKYSIIYINKILKDKLKILGYADSQIVKLLEEYINVSSIVPKDLLEDIPFRDDVTIKMHNNLKELIY